GQHRASTERPATARGLFRFLDPKSEPRTRPDRAVRARAERVPTGLPQRLHPVVEFWHPTAVAWKYGARGRVRGDQEHATATPGAEQHGRASGLPRHHPGPDQ